MSVLDHIADPAIRQHYESMVETVYRDAHERQGRRCFESTRRAAAFHEAGHALVYTITADRARWWPPYRVQIWRAAMPEDLSDLTMWLGETQVSPKAPPIRVQPDDAPGMLIYALRAGAGAVSEMLFDGTDYRLASSADELLVVGGCARHLAALHWQCEPEEAMALLFGGIANMLRANADTVNTLARVLERQRKVQGRELASLLRYVRKQLPAMTQELRGRATLDGVMVSPVGEVRP